MQASPDSSSKRLVETIAPIGNTFLLLILPELRKQGLTFLAFYALQRILDEPGLTERLLRIETGLEDYEVSRACKLLVDSDLATISRSEADRRVRCLTATARGERFRDRVLLAAAGRLQYGVPASGRQRRFLEAAESFLQGNRTLRGGLQLSFLDPDLFDEEAWERPRTKRRTIQPTHGSSMSSKA